MKKKLTALFLSLVMMCSLVACGDEPAPDAPAEGTIKLPVTGTEVDASLFQEPLSISYLGYRYDLVDCLTGYLEKMEDVPGVTVDEIYDYNMESMFNLACAAGGNNPYSIMHATNQGFFLYASEDYLQPLDEYIEKYWDDYDFGDIPQEYWDWVTIDGHIYAIPFAFNVQHMFYRKDVFEQYGLEVPTTWDEMVETAKELKAKGWDKATYISAYALPGGINGEFTNFINNMGGGMYDEETNRPSFNNEIGIKALEKLQEVVDILPEAALTYSTDDVTLLMQTGEAAMTHIWSTRGPTFEDPTVSSVAGKMGCAPALALEKGGVPTNQLNWDAFCIPKNVTGDPEAVFLAMAEMTSYEAQTESANLSIPTRNKPLEEHPEIRDAHPEYKALEDSVANGAWIYPFHKFPFYQLGADIVASYVNDAMLGNISYEDALSRAEKDVTVLLTDMGYIKD